MFREFQFTNFNLVIFLIGSFILLSVLLPLILKKHVITEPIIYLVLGAVYYILTGDFKPSKIVGDTPLLLRISEITVLVALTSSGLKLNKPFSRETWTNSRRLLLIGMPITIALTYLLGNLMLGMLPATAMLLAATLSPTDPVLASELQTSDPGVKDGSPTRLALTSEAGINDGLAFPFTYLAIRLAEGTGMDKAQVWEWIYYDLVYRIFAGLLVGVIMGFLLYKLIFYVLRKCPSNTVGTGMLSLSLSAIPYVSAELIHGYGFISVFIAACMFRHLESGHEEMKSLHRFSEEIENLMIGILFIVFGVYSALNWRLFLNWELASAALLLIFIVRPVAGYLSFPGSKLNRWQKFVMSFYGIRGIGSIYYLAFALQSAYFRDKATLIGLVFITIIASAFIHGLSAGFFTKKLMNSKGEEVGVG